MNDDIRKILEHLTAELVYRDFNKMTDEDVTEACVIFDREISAAIEGIHHVIMAEIGEQVGQVIDTIREAEGIDPDVVDSIFGCQPEDL